MTKGAGRYGREITASLGSGAGKAGSKSMKSEHSLKPYKNKLEMVERLKYKTFYTIKLLEEYKGKHSQV